jgi:hypothetical protein
LAFTDITGQSLSTAVQSNTITPAGFNVPVTVSFAGTGTNPLTSLGISVQGGAFSTSPQTVQPGQTLRMQGTTGAANSIAYGVVVTMGSPAATDTWTATTTAVAASIATPSITSPANGATGLNPALNSPAGIPLVGSAYTPQNGAGAVQTSSTWEVYKGGFPLGPSTGTITTVTPGTAGTPGGVQYKTSASSDTNPNSQNEVFGKLATDQFNNAAHPPFQWAKGLNIGGFTDWYVPAKNELEILYFNLKPDTTVNNTSSGINPNAVPPRASVYGATPTRTSNALFQSAGSEAFSAVDPYWSSTEYSTTTTNAWEQFFANGGQTFTTKNTGQNARAVRRVPLT